MTTMIKNTAWHYAEPDIERILSLPVLAGFDGIRPGDHLFLTGGSSGKRIARVISNTPAGRGNGIVELKTVWTANQSYDPIRATTTTSQWRSLTTNGARFFTPEQKPVVKPAPAPAPARSAPNGQLQLPVPAQPQTGTLNALNCIHAAMVESTRQADAIAKQTWGNIGEIADIQAETNGLLREILAEIKALRAAWEGK